jgi:gag-polypeptide of LTR copia-type
LSFNDEVNFGIIEEAVTTDLTTGDLNLAWEKLKSRQEPTTTANRASLKYQFSNSKMTENRDPDQWISDLERLRSKLKLLKSEISEEDLMVHIINYVGHQYSNIADHMETDLDKRTLTLDDVKSRLRAKYNRLKNRQEHTKSHDESALTAYAKQYKGRCNKCGNWGHKGADCKTKTPNHNPGYQKQDSSYKKQEHANLANTNPDHGTATGTDSGNGTFFSGACNYCKIKGHRSQIVVNVSTMRKRKSRKKK